MATKAYMHPIDYTSRDYMSLRQDLVKLLRGRVPEWVGDDPSDFGVAMVEAFAYVGDILNYYIDRVAGETFLSTASQRQSILNIASLLGYTPTGKRAATTTLRFTNNTDSDQIIPWSSTVNGVTTVTSLYVNTEFEGAPLTLSFELSENYESADLSWVVPANSFLDVPATEGKTYLSQLIGTTNGYRDQVLYIYDQPLLADSLEIKVQDTDYTYTANLVNAKSTDTAFTYTTNPDGSTSIILGNGINGVVPPANQNVYATYRVGGGTEGNIAVNQYFYLSSNVPFLGSITNITPGIGGINEESIESIRLNASRAFRTRQRLITLRDFEDAALSSPEVAKAAARGNYLGNILVYASPRRSGILANDPAPGYYSVGVTKKKKTTGTAPNNSSTLVTLTLDEEPLWETGTSVYVGGVDGSQYGFSNVTVSLVGKSAAITTINGDSSVVTVTADNDFVVGQSVAITGASPYNGTATVVTATPYEFTYASSTTGSATLSSAAATAVLGNNQGWLETVNGVPYLVYKPDPTSTSGGTITADTSCDGVLQGRKTDIMTDIQTSLVYSMESSSPAGTGVSVLPPRYLDLKISITLALKPTSVQSTTVNEVRNMLLSMFDYENVGFNELIRKEEILAEIIKGVPEVLYSTVDVLQNMSTSSSVDAVQGASDEIFRLLPKNLSVSVNPAYPGITA